MGKCPRAEPSGLGTLFNYFINSLGLLPWPASACMHPPPLPSAPLLPRRLERLERRHARRVVWMDRWKEGSTMHLGGMLASHHSAIQPFRHGLSLFSVYSDRFWHLACVAQCPTTCPVLSYLPIRLQTSADYRLPRLQ